jgi:hypothetical protein
VHPTFEEFGFGSDFLSHTVQVLVKVNVVFLLSNRAKKNYDLFYVFFLRTHPDPDPADLYGSGYTTLNYCNYNVGLDLTLFTLFRCAGEVAAVAFNDYCGVGVAYNASIGGKVRS